MTATKLIVEMQEKVSAKDPEPLRFRDLEEGDVFRFKEDAEEPGQWLAIKLGRDRYRHLTRAIPVMVMATEMETAFATQQMMAMEVERYPRITISLSEPERFKY